MGFDVYDVALDHVTVRGKMEGIIGFEQNKVYILFIVADYTPLYM